MRPYELGTGRFPAVSQTKVPEASATTWAHQPSGGFLVKDAETKKIGASITTSMPREDHWMIQHIYDQTTLADGSGG